MLKITNHSAYKTTRLCIDSVFHQMMILRTRTRPDIQYITYGPHASSKSKRTTIHTSMSYLCYKIRMTYCMFDKGTLDVSLTYHSFAIRKISARKGSRFFFSFVLDSFLENAYRKSQKLSLLNKIKNSTKYLKSSALFEQSTSWKHAYIISTPLNPTFI